MIETALYVQVIVWLLVILLFLMTRQASIYHPLTMYLGFHGLVFVIRPLLVHFLEFDHEFLYMGIQPDQMLLVKTLAVSSLGLVVFAAATLGFGWCRVQFRSAAPAPFTPEQRRALLILAILLLPVVAYSIRAGQTDFATEERGGTYMMVGASGYAIEAQLMAGPLVCALLAVTRFQWGALLLLVPYVGYRAFAGMSRWSFVLLFVALGLMYAWQTRRKWLPWWILVCVIPVFPLFKAIGDNRGLVKDLIAGEIHQPDPTKPGMSALDRFRAKYDGPDFANFDFLTYVVAMVPERTGTYTYGTQYLQLFTEPIPRKLWPGKPAGAPIGFFNLNNYGDFLGRTVTLVGDGWMSGGWLGVVITMTLVGTILGLAHRWFWRHSQNNMIALLYLVGLAMLPQWFRDGGISIAKFLFWNLSPLMIWCGLTWLLGDRLFPGYSILLPRGGGVQVIGTESRGNRLERSAPGN
jgi:hypothetical protein